MPMLVGDIIRRQARINARKVGLVDGDRALTYREIDERVNRLGHALAALGLRKGDRLAFMANNCHEIVEAYLAAAKTGLVMVPVNARFSASEVEWQLAHAEADAFIYQAEFDEIGRKVRGSLARVRHFVRIGEAQDGAQSYEALLSAASPKDPVASALLDDLLVLMYTSGTTGTAKGVMIKQINLLAAINGSAIDTRAVPEDVSLLVMPLFHAGGIWPTLTQMYRGARTVLLPRFEEEKVLRTIEQEKVTFLNLVPTMLRRLVTSPALQKYNLESLRFIMYAGAPIPLHQLRDAMRLLGAHRFHTGLGSTEAGTGGILTFPTTEHALALDGPLADKLGSVGRDATGVEVRIVDEGGCEVATGVVGEIVARGDLIPDGYWKRPEDTGQTFRDGWLYTGDLGYRDEDGYVFVAGRKKDLIISGGENISSLEVEEAVSQHPAVAEVAVLGVPDELWGEAVKAIVALRSEFRGQVDDEEIVSHCRQRLAGFKVPKSVDFVDELPKTAAGKIMKADLAREYRQRYMQQQSN